MNEPADAHDQMPPRMHELRSSVSQKASVVLSYRLHNRVVPLTLYLAVRGKMAARPSSPSSQAPQPHPAHLGLMGASKIHGSVSLELPGQLGQPHRGVASHPHILSYEALSPPAENQTGSAGDTLPKLYALFALSLARRRNGEEPNNEIVGDGYLTCV